MPCSTRTPTLLPLPVRYVNGGIEQVPGFDPRRSSLYSPYWTPDLTLTSSNGRIATNVNDGLTAKADALGVEAEIDLGQGFKLTEKFRHARQSGRFVGVFPGDDVHAAPAGTTVATGPDAGKPYTGQVVTGVVFNTSLDDLGLTANDLRVAKTFTLGEGSSLQATAGLYTSTQQVGMTWSFNQYALQATGDRPALLKVPGFVNGSAAFGGCCQNFTDSSYATNAVYGGLQFDRGPLSLEASVRGDRLRASGVYRQTLFDGGTPGVAYNLDSARTIDYRVRHTSYSVGANVRLNKDTAVFARYSNGVAFNGDRITFFNDPNLVNGRSSVIPVNEVKQAEGGLKWRSGALQTFATLFLAKTDESNVDVTTAPIKVTATGYDAKGLELEGSWRAGWFRVAGGLTYTDASVVRSTNPAIVGKTPRRTAKLVYQLAPSVAIGDLEFGASIIGTTKSQDDTPAGPLTVTLPGYTVVNAFASYALTERATLQLGVNNLGNVVGYTESNDGRGAARSINGRTAKITLSYEL
jgi:outer membrane receptor protein involved in Fe transport